MELMEEDFEPKKKNGNFHCGEELVKLLVFIFKTLTYLSIISFSTIIISFFLSIAFPINVERAVKILFSVFQNI